MSRPSFTPLASTRPHPRFSHLENELIGFRPRGRAADEARGGAGNQETRGVLIDSRVSGP